jgi:hypothetical protein
MRILILALLVLVSSSIKTHFVENDDEWIYIFDGETFNGWHQYNSDSVGSQWSIENGELVFTDNDERLQDLLTDKEYTNFELSIEWNISKGGNSGIFWGVNENKDYSVPYLSAAEIQVLDDDIYGKNDTANFNHMNGALYDMVAPSKLFANPTGEWNHYLIEINYNDNVGNVDLNGNRAISFPLEGPEWDALINNSKFRDWKGFANTKTGPIAFQDHGTKVYYRNIKIKEL